MPAPPPSAGRGEPRAWGSAGRSPPSSPRRTTPWQGAPGGFRMIHHVGLSSPPLPSSHPIIRWHYSFFVEVFGAFFEASFQVRIRSQGVMGMVHSLSYITADSDSKRIASFPDFPDQHRLPRIPGPPRPCPWGPQGDRCVHREGPPAGAADGEPQRLQGRRPPRPPRREALQGRRPGPAAPAITGHGRWVASV